MDRQAMAEKLLKASGLAVIWDEVQFSIREPFLTMADAAIAECAKDAEIARLRACIAEIKADAEATTAATGDSRTMQLMARQASDTLAIIASHEVSNGL